MLMMKINIQFVNLFQAFCSFLWQINETASDWSAINTSKDETMADSPSVKNDSVDLI